MTEGKKQPEYDKAIALVNIRNTKKEFLAQNKTKEVTLRFVDKMSRNRMEGCSPLQSLVQERTTSKTIVSLTGARKKSQGMGW